MYTNSRAGHPMIILCMHGFQIKMLHFVLQNAIIMDFVPKISRIIHEVPWKSSVSQPKCMNALALALICDIGDDEGETQKYTCPKHWI